MRKKTGINHLTNHVCRHTFVTRLCEKGASAKAIAQIIGHAKTNYVMDIYALIEKKQLKRDIYKLEDNNNTLEDNKKCVIILPPALYKCVANIAISNGVAVDKFVAQAIQASIKTEPLPKIINLYEILKK